jgi:hypothetical protein
LRPLRLLRPPDRHPRYPAQETSYRLRPEPPFPKTALLHSENGAGRLAIAKWTCAGGVGHGRATKTRAARSCAEWVSLSAFCAANAARRLCAERAQTPTSSVSQRTVPPIATRLAQNASAARSAVLLTLLSEEQTRPPGAGRRNDMKLAAPRFFY